MPNIVEIGQHL